jgi:hypothetical protein
MEQCPFDKLIVPIFYAISTFISCSTKLTADPKLEANKSRPHSHFFFNVNLNIILPSMRRQFKWFCFSFKFSDRKIVCIFISFMLATCSSHLKFLDLIILLKSGQLSNHEASQHAVFSSRLSFTSNNLTQCSQTVFKSAVNFHRNYALNLRSNCSSLCGCISQRLPVKAGPGRV